MARDQEPLPELAAATAVDPGAVATHTDIEETVEDAFVGVLKRRASMELWTELEEHDVGETLREETVENTGFGAVMYAAAPDDEDEAAERARAAADAIDRMHSAVSAIAGEVEGAVDLEATTELEERVSERVEAITADLPPGEEDAMTTVRRVESEGTYDDWVEVTRSAVDESRERGHGR